MFYMRVFVCCYIWCVIAWLVHVLNCVTLNDCFLDSVTLRLLPLSILAHQMVLVIWRSRWRYLYRDIVNYSRSKRLSLLYFNWTVYVKDTTGLIDGTIHRKVLTESEFAKDISVKAAIILKKVFILYNTDGKINCQPDLNSFLVLMLSEID